MAQMERRKGPSQARACRFLILVGLFLPLALLPAFDVALAGIEESIVHGGFFVKAAGKTEAYRADELFLPASTLKVATSLLALDRLGPEYRFSTKFYLDSQDNLYIQGFGDPFLTSEEVLRISLSLKKAGVEHVHSLFLDDSAFSIEGPPPGSGSSSNPYDARNGALAVNFNTVSVVACQQGGDVCSGEPQTPTLPLMRFFKSRVRQNPQRFTIGVLEGKTELPPELEYVGQLFAAQLRSAGVEVGGGIALGPVPIDLKPLLVSYNSIPLSEVVRGCLRYSNNFIANQLLLVCCMEGLGVAPDWRSAADFFQKYLAGSLGLKQSEIQVAEGSGLSRRNRASARAMVRILEGFRNYRTLLVEDDRVLLKTGTMQDVYCLVGYINGRKRPIPFAILLNQTENIRDTILELFKAAYGEAK